MKLFFLLSLLAMSLVDEGTCHEIREIINATVQQAPPLNNFQDNPAASCKELHELHPDAPSGYYEIGRSGSSVSVYCDMTRTCGNLTGGWMRVANIDMTNTNQQCPLGFRQTSYSSKRLCNIGYPGREYASTNCVGHSFSVHKLEYSRVCGRIIGYQYYRPIAFTFTRYPQYDNIDSNLYVYGVSLTHGQNPRKHIWTFAGASDEDLTHPSYKCPCINYTIIPPERMPSFIGSDYFCDTAVTNSHRLRRKLYTSDPLWDGEGCGRYNICCSDPDAPVHPPWFIKYLPSHTSDDIDMRLCGGGRLGSTPIEIVELYVQ